MASAIPSTSLEQRLKATRIDYSAAASGLPDLLLQPSNDDDLKTLWEKVRDLAHVVEAGGSVAVAIGAMAPVEPPPPEPQHTERFAPAGPPDEELRIERETLDEMQQSEQRAYTNWQADGPPDFDWDHNVADFSMASKRTRKAYRARAAIMDRIWDQEGTTLGHAAWVSRNDPALLTLISAVGKVEAARTKAAGPLGAMRPAQDRMARMMAELEALDSTVGTANQRREQLERDMAQMLEDLESSIFVLQGRARVLKELQGGSAQTDHESEDT